MPTKLKRYSVSLPIDLETMIEKEADFTRRPVSNQIVYILDMWFAEKKKELDYFRPTRLREVERSEAQIFETPALPHAEHVSKLRESLGREKS